jgi:two-component system response regulator
MKAILLVEDNASDELLTIHALKKANIACALVVARDGEEALEYLFGSGAHAGRDTNDLPAVVLLDLNLPKVGGLEVLRRMRADERSRRLPVVVLTSSAEEEDIIMSYDLGANGYVRKSVDLGQFVEGVKTLGLFWLHLNEAPPPRRRTR